MKDITIIVPVLAHENDEKFDALNKDSFESVKKVSGEDGKVILVGAKEALERYEDAKNIKKVVNDGSTDFATQVNLGVAECKTKFFTVVEEDDIVSDKWFDIFKEYEPFYSDVAAFLPLTELYDYNNLDKGAFGYANEVVWAASFSQEIGYIDLDCLKNFMEFNLTGTIFGKKEFVACGGLKPSMKLTYWYEFLMRFVNNNNKAFVIPKVGYLHILNRPGSVSDTYNKTLKPEEAEWWIDLAQKEYLYKKDRNKTYEE